MSNESDEKVDGTKGHDGEERSKAFQDGNLSSPSGRGGDASNVVAPQHALLEKFRPLPIDISVSSPSESSRREGTPQNVLPISALLWEGGTLWKIPFHVLGRSKRKYVRLKRGGRDRSKLRVSPQPPPTQSDELGSPSQQRYFAAYPLCLEWGDLDRALPKDFFLKDAREIRAGRRTPAFLAYAARHGPRSVPDEAQCFSVVGAHRSLDFAAETALEATRWRDALSALLTDVEAWKGRPLPFSPDAVPTPPSPHASRGWKQHSHAGAMFAAVKSGNVEAFQWHLDRGCPVDFMEDVTADTPLIAACRLGKEEVVKLALERGAKNDPHPDFGQTALQVAVSTGSTGCARLILDTAAPSGSDVIIVNHEDSNKEAPLHIASRCGNLAILELLVLHGANMRLVDSSGRTCLHCAAQGGHTDCLMYLLDAGGDALVEDRDNHGLTCLHLAVRANRLECARLLLEAAADAMAATFDGLTAIELARRQKSQQMIRMLEEYDKGVGNEESLPRPHSPSSVPDNGGIQADASKRKTGLFEGLDLYSPSSNSAGAKNNERLGQLQKYIGPSPLSSAIIQQGQNRSHLGGIEGAVSPGLISSSYKSRIAPSFSSPRGTFVFRNGEGSYSVGNVTHEQGATPQNNVEYLHHYANDSTHQTHFGCYNVTQTQLDVGREGAYSGSCGSLEFHVGIDAWVLLYDSGYPYFLRVRDGHSQWDDPRQMQFAAVANASPSHCLDHSLAGASHCDGEKFYSPAPDLQVTENHETHPVDKSPVVSLTNQALRESPLVVANNPASDGIVQGGEASAVGEPELAKYVKMASVGVPVGAIESKMRQDSMSPSQVAQVLSAIEPAKESTRQSTNSSVAKTTVPPKNTPPVETSESLSRYDRMVSVGVPVASVLHKMSQDGVDDHNIKSFAAKHKSAERKSSSASKADDKLPSPPPSDVSANRTDEKSPSPPAAELSTKETEARSDPALMKYSKMISVGVPPDSVVHKMKTDGVSPRKISVFVESNGLSHTTDKSSRESRGDEQIPSLSKEDLMNDQVLSKFVKMASVGVPPAAVVSKMGLEGVPEEKMLMFQCTFGLISKDEAGQKRKFSQAVGNPLLPPCPPTGRRTSVKMQKIHWKAVAEEKLHDSLWASGDFAHSDVDQAELEQLESLFGAKSPGVKRKTATTKNAKKEVRLIELKRANNVAISLAQFRAFKNYDELCQAVVVQDQEHLNAERLLNLKSLLPTAQELGTIKNYRGGTEGLGSAELFFIAVAAVPRFSQKLQAFLSALQFPELVKESLQSLELLAEACMQVTESQKLASMLRRLLVVGNVMNESAGKPKAAGITLDSLLKTANKKGSDGKTTVLDHVVATLMKQGDPENTIDFWKNMPCVRDAIRIDIKEARSVFKELQARTKTVQSTVELEEKLLEEGSACQNAAKFIDCSQSFIAKATKSLVQIEDALKDVEGKVKSLCSFFAEDANLCQSTSIFSVLVEFSKLVDRSKECWKRKERAEKRRAAMNTPIKTSRGTPAKSNVQKEDVKTRKNKKEDGRSLLLQSISQRRLSMSTSDG